MVSRARPRIRHRKAVAALAATALAGLTAGAAAVLSPSAQAATTGLVRVDQAGFLAGEVKQAYLMTGAAVSGATFAVLDSSGATVLTGKVGGTSLGKWNTAYPDVYPIVFSGLKTPGTYRIKVAGSAAGTSPSFTVAGANSLYGKLVADGVTFFQTQRDGSAVIAGSLHRQPSHLHDSSAGTYAWPEFAAGGSDTITTNDLTKLGGTVDVSGGWFDAGDYLKFSNNEAFGDITLFAAQRALGSAAPASLGAEAHFGQTWLNKAWNQSTKTLVLQVGIGSGNSAGTFYGDHDLWRLPQKDDGDTASADRYAAAHRPVFLAAGPGACVSCSLQISPNLAGRVGRARRGHAGGAGRLRRPARRRSSAPDPVGSGAELTCL